MKRNSIAELSLASLAVAMVGCGRTPNPVTQTVHEAPQRLVQTAPKERVSNRPANPKGGVFILMYHRFENGKGEVFRTPAEFQKDLERLYNDGFRPVTLSEYIDNRMDLPPGASPVVFTFDDATTTQLTLGSDGNPTPECAVGLWQAFAAKHPDFPVHGTFFVLPGIMWGQHKLTAQKVALIKALGSELANHTVTHPDLHRLSDAGVEKEVAGATDYLATLGVAEPDLFALPYGVWPKNRHLLTQGFQYNGKKYGVKCVVLAGSTPARSPNDKKFNPYHLPRIVPYGGKLGIDDWLNEVEKGRFKPYVAP